LSCANSFWQSRFAAPQKPWEPNIPIEEKRKKLSVDAPAPPRKTSSCAENPLASCLYSTMRLESVPLGVVNLGMQPLTPASLLGCVAATI
jgi:hypothetical protein